jgi:hypothetical protein
MLPELIVSVQQKKKKKKEKKKKAFLELQFMRIEVARMVADEDGDIVEGDGDNDTVLVSLGVFEAGIAGVDLDKDMQMKVLTRGRLSTSLKDIDFDKKKEKLCLLG